MALGGLPSGIPSRPDVTISGNRRATMMPKNNNLAEELEKTEQSITLTLQEIDRNFIQANRIISESVLPALEKYTVESRRLWNGVGFWKKFLESAAEVTLSTYEEIAGPLEELSIREETLEGILDDTAQDDRDSILADEFHQTVHSTPAGKRPASPSKIPVFIETPERRTPLKLTTATSLAHPSIKKEDLDEDISMASPLSFKTPKKGVLRHQVLDRNWRIQATPKPTKPSITDNFLDELDDDSLGEPELPKLESHVFSPAGNTNSSPKALSKFSPKEARHTPRTSHKNFYDESDSDIDMIVDGMSPPVTLHFGLSQNQLQKTPSKQAVRTVVDDILRDAGVADDSESMLSQETYFDKRQFLQADSDDSMIDDSLDLSP
jgi:DASH complex subunit ASK1